MRIVLRQFIQYIFILLIQVLILNDIVIRSSLTLWGIPAFVPMIYPMVVLLLPVNTAPWLAMCIGMFTGFIMDMFSNTPGMHAAATVLLAFIRPYLLALLFQQSAKELGLTVPGIFRMGFISFLLYAASAILIHHLAFYLIQIWNLRDMLYILIKTFTSGFISILIILISQLLFARREVRRL